MNDYEVAVTHVDAKPKGDALQNHSKTTRGAIVVDGIKFEWTAFTTSRHGGDMGCDDRNGHITVLIPSVSIRTKPVGLSKHKDWLKFRHLIVEAAGMDDWTHSHYDGPQLPIGTDEDIPF